MMSQGNWGGGGPGGGWGPPGGAPPGGAPPGGYGLPQGGYGPPQGGGYGGPPQGGGFGPPGYGPPPGAPPGYTPGGGGFGRFTVHALIGGVIGGVICAIPGFDIFNRCCFCIINMASVAIGLSLYLKANPQDRINSGEAAAFGAMSGAVAGLIVSILKLIIGLLFGSMFMAFLYRLMPRVLFEFLAQITVGGILGIPVNLLLFSAFGALGGFLSMQLFFKDRLAS